MKQKIIVDHQGTDDNPEIILNQANISQQLATKASKQVDIAPTFPQETGKKRTILFLALMSIVALGVMGYFTYQDYTLKLKEQPSRGLQTPPPEITEGPKTSTPLPSTVPQETPTPTIIPAKKITYKLPLGWQTIKDSSSQFEIGFSPNEFTAFSYPSRVDLIGKQCCFNFFIRIEPYDGKSRHAFLNKHFQGYETFSRTFEKNYLVGERSGLVIYNVEYSSTTIIGMIDIDGKSAFVFSSTGSDEKEIEEILSTINLLQ